MGAQLRVMLYPNRTIWVHEACEIREWAS
jgi:hypothetical protein